MIADYKQSLLTLMAEAYGLSNAKIGFFLENGSAGLFGQMGRIDAATASARLGEGHETIASHCQHLLYTFKFFMSFETGRPIQPDWASSWQPQAVSEAEWAQLQADLRDSYNQLVAALTNREEWPAQAIGAGMMMLAHTSYHVGVIDKMITLTEV